MVTFLHILRGQRVVHLVDGAVRAVYGPGSRTVWTLGAVHEFHRITTALPMKALTPADPVPADAAGSRIIEVGAHERVAVFAQGQCVQVLEVGRWRWWEDNGEPTLLRIDRGAVPAPLGADDPLPAVLPDASVVQLAEPRLLTHDGAPHSVLAPGRYRIWERDAWAIAALPNGFQAASVARGARVEGEQVEIVAGHERAVVFRNGTLLHTLVPGRYVGWEAAGPYEVVRFDVREPPAALAADDRLPPGSRDGAWVEVAGHASLAVVLVRDGQPEVVLPEGRYRAWVGSRWSLKGVPLSLQALDVAAQDLLTADEVPIRVKPAVTVRVSDPVAVLREPDWANQVYLAVQLALREVVTARTLEALLTERESLGVELRDRARALVPAAIGMTLETAAVKDIILPGEVKDLLNRVTLARKEAEALSIKRREETAATRQLANTARLLEHNPVLLRLKELEALGEIAGRIDRITLVGSGGELMRTVLLSDLAKGGDPPAAE